MNRSDFLKLMGVGSIASVVPITSEGKTEEKIVTESKEHDLEELYQIMTERKPFSIGGVEFLMTSLEQEFYGEVQFGHGRVGISANIVATGKFT